MSDDVYTGSIGSHITIQGNTLSHLFYHFALVQSSIKLQG